MEGVGARIGKSRGVTAKSPAERLVGRREAVEGLMKLQSKRAAREDLRLRGSRAVKGLTRLQSERAVGGVGDLRAGKIVEGVRDLRAERTIEAQTEEHAGKFSRNDLDSLPMRLTRVEKQLLEKLFDEIVLPFDELFEGSVNKVLGSLNIKFRRVLGENAVFGRTLQGSTPTGETFYWFALNLNLFDAVERKPEVGVHYSLRDVFTPLQLKIIDCLKKHGCCTIRALAGEVGVRESAVRSQVCRILDKTCRKKRLPLAIEKKGRNPTGYCLSEKFTSHFKMEVARKIGLDAFSGRQRKVILFLAESPDRTAQEIGARVGCGRVNVLAYVERINERAEALGAKAIEAHFVRRTMHFRLSEAIDCGPGVKVEKKRELRDYFTEKQAETIEFIATHPYSTVSEMAEGLNAIKTRMKSRLKGIMRNGSRNNLPSVLVRMDRMHSRYLISPEFAALFGLEAAAASHKSFLTPALYRVYDFFKKNPNATTAEASAELGISAQTVAQHVREINVVLRERGFETVSYKYSVNSRYRDSGELRKHRIAFRRRNGKWPVKLENNGVARNRVWGALSMGGQRELVSLDWARIERANALERFDGAGKIVEREVLSALWRGASAARILKIIKRNENAGRTMRALEKA